jgi:hypothetical protein
MCRRRLIFAAIFACLLVVSSRQDHHQGSKASTVKRALVGSGVLACLITGRWGKGRKSREQEEEGRVKGSKRSRWSLFFFAEVNLFLFLFPPSLF